MIDSWSSADLDLSAYLDRIAAEAGRPTAATLVRLHRAHVAAIGFENLDLVLGHGIQVDLASVQSKLVDGGRGGYCYEHGVLFAAVLQRLGYSVDRLLARIGHDPERPRPRTHMMLHVTGEDGEWLADVGFGAGLIEPVTWRTGEVRHQGGWSYRIVVDDGSHVLQEQAADGWSSLYTFTTEPQQVSDVEMANHFTSSHPSSPFLAGPIAMRRTDHARHRLRGRHLELHRPDGTVDERDIGDDEIGDVLRGQFGIRLDDDQVATIRAALD